MEQDRSAQRQSRTAQFLAWLRGDQAQTQQQRQQSDRQAADGYTRGNEDPDARSAASRSSAEAFATQREQERTERQQQAADRREAQPRAANDSRFAALEVAKRLREAQDRATQRQQGRGR